MYTRCSHCKAVFRVTMKELTAAQGKLRCGECASVFNAMDSLSTKLPEQEDTPSKVTFDTLNQKPKEKFRASPVSEQISNNENSNKQQRREALSSYLPITLASLLTIILASQVWLTRDIWLSNARAPDKIRMLSRKVFTHPSQPDALIITGAIENISDKSQPYPYLEARLLNADDQVIALRRFRPHEYLENYEKKQLLEGNQQVSIRLKIQDPPGHNAKQFKFSFL